MENLKKEQKNKLRFYIFEKSKKMQIGIYIFLQFWKKRKKCKLGFTFFYIFWHLFYIFLLFFAFLHLFYMFLHFFGELHFFTFLKNANSQSLFLHFLHFSKKQIFNRIFFAFFVLVFFLGFPPRLPFKPIFYDCFLRCNTQKLVYS